MRVEVAVPLTILVAGLAIWWFMVRPARARA